MAAAVGMFDGSMRGVFLFFLAALSARAGSLTLSHCEMRELDGGKRLLEAQVATTENPPPNVRRVQMRVAFFERGDGPRLPGAPEQVFQWTNLPVNWRKSGSESFAVHYPKPGPGLAYGGYAVAVYLDGTLQDVKSSRRSLLRKFPFPQSLNAPPPAKP
jgi:hypothetical protein